MRLMSLIMNLLQGASSFPHTLNIISFWSGSCASATGKESGTLLPLASLEILQQDFHGWPCSFKSRNVSMASTKHHADFFIYRNSKLGYRWSTKHGQIIILISEANILRKVYQVPVRKRQFKNGWLHGFISDAYKTRGKWTIGSDLFRFPIIGAVQKLLGL